MITFSLDLNDSVFDDSGPFSVTPNGAGVSLDQALREFGPAAIDDLIPRLRALAAALDDAHAAGFVHGRLHPSKVLITDDGTYVMGRRVPASAALTREADQYALASIAYEWMFGRPISGTGDRPVDVRSIPGVDRAALSRAFTRALSPEPSRRFASCSDFVEAVAAAVTPSLPLMAVDDDDHPVGPFMPEDPAAAVPIAMAEPVPDLSFPAEEPKVTEPDLHVAEFREPRAGLSGEPEAGIGSRKLLQYCSVLAVERGRDQGKVWQSLQRLRVDPGGDRWHGRGLRRGIHGASKSIADGASRNHRWYRRAG